MRHTINKYSTWYITGLLTVLILFTEIMHADSFLYKQEPQPSNWHCTLASTNQQATSQTQLPSMRHNVGVQCSEATQKPSIE